MSWLSDAISQVGNAALNVITLGGYGQASRALKNQEQTIRALLSQNRQQTPRPAVNQYRRRNARPISTLDYNLGPSLLRPPQNSGTNTLLGS